MNMVHYFTLVSVCITSGTYYITWLQGMPAPQHGVVESLLNYKHYHAAELAELSVSAGSSHTGFLLKRCTMPLPAAMA